MKTVLTVAERQPGLRSLLCGIPVLAIYLAACALLITHLSDRAWNVGRHLFFAFGVLQIWRLSTMTIHIVRALWYQFRVFPRWRRAADAVPDAQRYPSRLAFIIPTCREKPEVSRLMLRSVLSEILPLPCPVSLYITTACAEEDEVFLAELRGHSIPENRVEIIFMRQPGKRSGMGFALRALARRGIDDRTLVVLMDGDTVLGPGLLEKTLPFFHLRPRLGALTTDNLAITTGAKWYQRWYDLRFSMRHRYMKSVSLSRRVLTLTGRFSIFRGPITVSEEFLRYIEDDVVEDWLYGKIRFITGDDKSTWFAVLKRQWEMIFVPDAYAVCMEDSSERPFPQAFAKMFRWFGNMLRNNGRAIALGPRCTGFFTWWCLVDQRLSIWTTLIGPTLAVFLACTANFYYLVFYLFVATMRRLIYLGVLALEGHRLRFIDLPLLFFTDWASAVMKISVLADLKSQRWAAREPGNAPEERAHAFMANFRRTVWWCLFVLGVMLYARG